jgi:DNA polymerase III epsilon subunit
MINRNKELITRVEKPTVKKTVPKEKKIRQIVLDTETTGLSPEEGHRIIEIGGVELINRRLTQNNFHVYLQPDRDIDNGAIKIHGITNEFLSDKPRFGDIAEEFINYLRGAELIIHNASFDIGFINAELTRWHTENGKNLLKINELCTILDTLALARTTHPGQRNNLDALCKRYNVDQTQRTKHGALLDAELLAQVYLAMTSGQSTLILNSSVTNNMQSNVTNQQCYINPNRSPLLIVRASVEEEMLHQERLQQIDKNSSGQCLWVKTIQNNF